MILLEPPKPRSSVVVFLIWIAIASGAVVSGVVGLVVLNALVKKDRIPYEVVERWKSQIVAMGRRL
jgi:hypothetical protein